MKLLEFLLYYYLSLNYIPVDNISLITEDSYIFSAINDAVELECDIEVLSPKKIFYLTGGLSMLSQRADNSKHRLINLQPLTTQYRVGLGFNWKIFSFGYEMSCLHSVGTIKHDRLDVPGRYGSKDKLYIKISNKEF